jgi:hypothetical protein
MKSPFILAILLCALCFGLGSCANAPERVDLIAEGDTKFTVFCAAAPACRQRAADLCRAQGYSLYDILEQLKGDELGEGRGIVIECKA